MSPAKPADTKDRENKCNLVPYYLYVECILDLFDKHMIIFTSSYVRIILFNMRTKYI
jgi:hypothetical protein